MSRLLGAKILLTATNHFGCWWSSRGREFGAIVLRQILEQLKDSSPWAAWRRVELFCSNSFSLWPERQVIPYTPNYVYYQTPDRPPHGAVTRNEKH